MYWMPLIVIAGLCLLGFLGGLSSEEGLSSFGQKCLGGLTLAIIAALILAGWV